jgi:hypothetical protein
VIHVFQIEQLLFINSVFPLTFLAMGMSFQSPAVYYRVEKSTVNIRVSDMYTAIWFILQPLICLPLVKTIGWHCLLHTLGEQISLIAYATSIRSTAV